MKVNKAVILAAGLGTRFLPITKTFPKEMLPVVDKPVIQYLIEEAVASGIKEIILVISPEKKLIKDYFKKNKKLEYFLKARKEKRLLQEVKKIGKFPKISYPYQEKPLGIGDAILCAEKEIKNEPFALFFADDIIISDVPCLKQLINLYQRYKNIIVAVTPVPKKEVFRYGVVKVKKIEKRVYQVLDLIEKPSFKEAADYSCGRIRVMSGAKRRTLRHSDANLAIVGRYILTPDIFPALKKLKPQFLRPGQEIYLTDALRILLGKNKPLPRLPSLPIYAYEYQGDWLSCGNKIGWLLANIKIGLQHPETREDLKKYLQL